MSLFHILVPSQVEDTPAYNTETKVLHDGFSAFAAWLPPIWALANKMWLEALAWIVFIIGLEFADDYLGPNTFWIYVLCAIWFGYEAQNLKIAALERRNFVLKGTLIAADVELAEMEWLRLSMQKTVEEPVAAASDLFDKTTQDFTGVQA